LLSADPLQGALAGGFSMPINGSDGDMRGHAGSPFRPFAIWLLSTSGSRREHY